MAGSQPAAEGGWVVANIEGARLRFLPPLKCNLGISLTHPTSPTLTNHLKLKEVVFKLVDYDSELLLESG